MDTTKLCKRCKETKSISEFSKNRSLKDGLSCYCKLCKKTVDREHYIANQEKYQERRREFYKNNRERIIARSRMLEKANPEKYRERRRKFRENNRERERDRSRAWAKANPEKARAQMKKAIAKQFLVNPEKIRARGVVNNHIRRGTLPAAKTLKCFRCGKQASEYHHHKGYAKEHRLDVVPVCYSCHRVLEREIK